MVHANINLPCPEVYTLSMSAPCVYYEVNMLLTYSLTSFIQSALVYSRLITSHHVICHVTTVMCLFIINQKKINIKSRKINKKKRKILVFKYTIITNLSRLLMMDLTFIFHFSFYFILFCFSFIFLFLEQLGLGFISHAVTSVTN